MAEYKTLLKLIEAHEYDPPEKLLGLIRQFFYTAGCEFRQGLISEDEFLCSTYAATDVCESLCEIQDIHIDRQKLSFNDGFKASWTQWKKSGTVVLEPWMEICIRQHGKMTESVELFFSIIDTCKIPLCMFDSIQVEDDVYPALWRRLGYDTTVFILAGGCLDMHKLLRDPFPRGHKYVLHFSGDICVDFVVDDMIEDANSERHYICTGTISDYLENPDRIDIKISKGGSMDVIFGSKKSTPLKTIMQTVLNPIPHSKWAKYNVSLLTYYLREEAEYKILRLPYMLGIDEQSPGDSDIEKPLSSQDGKIIYLHS